MGFLFPGAGKVTRISISRGLGESLRANEPKSAILWTPKGFNASMMIFLISSLDLTGVIAPKCTENLCCKEGLSVDR
jgi:hypothetical protein